MESGFRINNLLLLESSFKREAIVSFDQNDVVNDVHIDVNVQTVGTIINVTETLNYTQKLNDTIEVLATIKMVGVFEKLGESALDLETFGHVNGAAIIFPYIREHLSNLSAKAGIGIILLPPYNFTKKEI